MPTTQEWNFCSVGGTGAHRVDRAAQIGPGRAISLGFTQLCHTKSRAKPTTDKLADKHPGPWQKKSHIFCLAIIHLPTYPSIHPPPPPSSTHSSTHPFVHIVKLGLLFNPKLAACVQGKNTPSEAGPDTQFSAISRLSGFWWCRLSSSGMPASLTFPVPTRHAQQARFQPPLLFLVIGLEALGRGEEARHAVVLCGSTHQPHSGGASRCMKLCTELCFPI